MACKHLALAGLAVAVGFSLPAWSQVIDQNLGRNLAASCATCHGTNGSSAGGLPSLAGQSMQALVLALKEFREGKRVATVMHQISKGYSDEQLEFIAAFFANQKVK